MYHHGQTTKKTEGFTSKYDKKQNVSSQDESGFEEMSCNGSSDTRDIPKRSKR